MNTIKHYDMRRGNLAQVMQRIVAIHITPAKMGTGVIITSCCCYVSCCL